MAVKKKVLLVEDDAFTRFMMREIIGTLGVNVEIAENGRAGTEIIERNPESFGLVLMDLHMPVMSGIEATRTIRAFPNDPPNTVPIVAVTADINYHDEAVVRELGMDGFASKPVSPGQLLNLISKYCDAA